MLIGISSGGVVDRIQDAESLSSVGGFPALQKRANVTSYSSSFCSGYLAIAAETVSILGAAEVVVFVGVLAELVVGVEGGFEVVEGSAIEGIAISYAVGAETAGDGDVSVGCGGDCEEGEEYENKHFLIIIKINGLD